MCGNKYKCPETTHKVFAIATMHDRKQKKLYVKHQCSKKYWIFNFRDMNFSDIMAEAVLSTEKTCLVSHATHFVAVLNALLKKWKEKLSNTVCAVLCEAYRQIHVSETQFACISSKG